MKYLKVLISLIMILMIISCAARTRISDIRESPKNFHDQPVTLTGVVDNTISFPVLNIGVYQIDDGTGKMWVKPTGEMPAKGDRVSVTGTIKVGLVLSGRSFGVILVE